jgi:spore germination protein KA
MEDTNNNLNSTLVSSIGANITLFKEILKDDETIVFREFENRQANFLKCCAIFVKGMVNKDIIDEHIIHPIMEVNLRDIDCKEGISHKTIIDILVKKVVNSASLSKKTSTYDLIVPLFYGETILLVDGVAEAILIETKGWATRGLQEPASERVVRGPKEGFTESIITNISLIRKRIRTTDLKFVFQEVGRQTKTKICVCYMDDIANNKIVEEVFKRLKNIDNDMITHAEMVDEFIRDSPLSIFKTIGNTERPDVAVGKLLEGRVLIIIDGTPFVLTQPYIFQEYFQSADDYTNNLVFASFNRMLRMMAFFLGISVPALYIAVTTYHQELIPTSLLLSISTAREGIPFPTVVEALVMLTGFEMLREAGVRLPQPIGQSVSIVGALVLGDAAVNARIISAPMVIVVAATGISSLLVAKMIGVFIIVRLIFLLMASIWGLYGYMYGVIGLFIYLFSIRSFGVPYMLYSTALKPEDLKDTIIRSPAWTMKYRPRLISSNRKRQKTN